VKRVIFHAARAAVAGGVPKQGAGILVDEQFGATPAGRGSSLAAPRRRAARTNSSSSTAPTTPATSRRSTRPSARCWCATTRGGTRR
jgi:hypothetical protein